MLQPPINWFAPDKSLSVLISNLDINEVYTVNIRGEDPKLVNPATPITVSTDVNRKDLMVLNDSEDFSDIYDRQKLGTASRTTYTDARSLKTTF